MSSIQKNSSFSGITDLFNQMDLLPDLMAAHPQIPDRIVQKMMAASVKLYVQKLESGRNLPAFSAEDQVTATDVAKTVTKMLQAADLEIFELAMWQGLGRAE